MRTEKNMAIRAGGAGAIDGWLVEDMVRKW